MPMSMSAADWTRMQRRVGGMNYDYTVGSITDATGNFPKDKDINPTALKQFPYGKALLIPPDVGGSKIRRPASEWTNFLGARNADYVLKSQGQGGVNETGLNTGAAKLTVKRLAACRCTAAGTLPSITLPKYAGCQKCNPAQHLAMN